MYRPGICTLARFCDNGARIQRLYDTILCMATVMVPCVLTSTVLQKQMHKLQQQSVIVAVIAFSRSIQQAMHSYEVLP